MPVSITIDGRPVLWGSPERGLSASEWQEYDDLHARHRSEEAELSQLLSSPGAEFRKAFVGIGVGQVDSAAIRRIEDVCQRLEATRRTFRGFVANPDVGVEWTWRYWVGRELADLRGCTGGIEITPGIRSAWGTDGFTPRPGLMPESRAHVSILLEKWTESIEQLREASRPFDLESAFGGERTKLSLHDGGRLLSQVYAYERALLPYSAFPSVLDPLPLPEDIRHVAEDERGMHIPQSDQTVSNSIRTNETDRTEDPLLRLREPTDDDRALFEQEGRWAERSYGERDAAVFRSLGVFAEADPEQGNARAAFVSNRDMIRALQDGDVDAWQRFWYFSRGIAPPGSDAHLRLIAARASLADLSASVSRAPQERLAQDVDNSGLEHTASEAASRQHLPSSRVCRGGCKNFRASYARDYWDITDNGTGKGEHGRATQQDLAVRHVCGERTIQRWLAGCPDDQDKVPRHTLLPWPPPRPDAQVE
jgi:hypothetical protein